MAAVDIIYGCAPGERYGGPSEYAQALCERMREAYAQVRECSQASALRRKLKHDFDGNFPKFQVGSLVWYYYTQKFSGLNQKW